MTKRNIRSGSTKKGDFWLGVKIILTLTCVFVFVWFIMTHGGKDGAR